MRTSVLPDAARSAGLAATTIVLALTAAVSTNALAMSFVVDGEAAGGGDCEMIGTWDRPSRTCEVSWLN